MSKTEKKRKKLEKNRKNPTDSLNAEKKPNKNTLKKYIYTEITEKKPPKKTRNRKLRP